MSLGAAIVLLKTDVSGVRSLKDAAPSFLLPESAAIVASGDDAVQPDVESIVSIDSVPPARTAKTITNPTAASKITRKSFGPIELRLFFRYAIGFSLNHSPYACQLRRSVADQPVVV